MHEPVAALQFFINPTRYIRQTFRRHTSAVPKPAIHGHGIFVLELLITMYSVFGIDEILYTASATISLAIGYEQDVLVLIPGRRADGQKPSMLKKKDLPNDEAESIVHYVQKTRLSRHDPSSARLKLRRGDIDRLLHAVHPTVPHAPAERCNVNHLWIFRIGNHPMAPFEVETRDARPVRAAIG